jgi:hypothetical protein
MQRSVVRLADTHFQSIENLLPPSLAGVLIEPCKQNEVNRGCQLQKSALATVSKTVSKAIKSD